MVIPSLNRVSRFFILGDLCLWSGWGFADPIFSVFVVQQVEGGTILSAGILATIYWVTKGIIQIPVSLFLDKTDGEKDDFYALIFGLMISSVAAFAFMTADSIGQVYLIQFVKSIGFALYIPAWSAIFSRHLDRDHTAFDWAVSSSSASLGIGLAGVLGGSIATVLGFRAVFLMAGLLGLFSAGMLLFIPNLILPKQTSNKSSLRDHRVQV